jgi:hypothetical protein
MLASATGVSEATGASRAPAYRAPRHHRCYSWTGLYVGVHAGEGWGDLGVGDSGEGSIGGVQGRVK